MKLMETITNGYKQKLIESKKTGDKIKVVFQYPNSTKLTVRKGNVIETYDNCFKFKDRFDGEMVFSYCFIIEICDWDGE